MPYLTKIEKYFLNNGRLLPIVDVLFSQKFNERSGNILNTFVHFDSSFIVFKKRTELSELVRRGLLNKYIQN